MADAVPQGSTVADIGADHAQLCIYLIKAGIADRCIAVEEHKAPCQRARLAAQKTRTADRIEVRLGSGLGPLDPGEVGVVCIAGMGSRSIVDILSGGAGVLAQVSRLVLQPVGSASVLRQWLLDHGWAISAEAMVEDKGRCYTVIEAGPGDAQRPYLATGICDVALEVGPLLLAQPSPQVLKHWRQVLQARRRTVQRLAPALLDTKHPGAALAQARLAMSARIVEALSR